MDKRSEDRVSSAVRFLVHVHECDDDPDMVGVSLSCKAVDFSIHGIQFRTDKVIAPGSLVNVTIGIGNPFAMYLVRRGVQWVRDSEGSHYMGVLLQDAAGTDLAKWRDAFDETFAPG